VTPQLNEWKNNQWSVTVEYIDPKDQSTSKMTKRVMRFPTPLPSLVTSVSEKSNALADSLEAQFQPITNPSVPALIEKFDEAYCLTPASESKITNPDEFQGVILGLKFGRAPGPN